jgi:hypothetical protein
MKVLSGLAIVLCTWWAWPGARQTIAQSKFSVGSVALLAEPKGADMRAHETRTGYRCRNTRVNHNLYGLHRRRQGVAEQR